MGKKKLFFQRNISIFPPNTFIGGIGLTINTPALLAAKLSCSESNVSNFEIIGNDVSCNIDVPYTFIDQAFYLNQEITSYYDGDALVSNLNAFNCFRDAINLVSVYFPVATTATANITNGNNPCFYGCSSLVDVYMPLMIRVEWSMFQLCTSLREVYFNNALSVENDAFNGCTSLEIAVIPNATKLKTNAFAYTSSLKIVEFNEVLTVTSYIFQYSGVQSVTMNKLTVDEGRMFFGSLGLTYLSLASKTNLSTSCFRNSKALKELHLPITTMEGGTNSGSTQFGGSTIASVNLPNLTTIVNNFMTYNSGEISFWYTPLLTSCGDSASTVPWTHVTNECIIVVNIVLQTINNGAEHAGLVAARNRGATIIYPLNHTPPNPITDLIANTVGDTFVELTWSQPTSVNNISFYRVFVDGELYIETEELSIEIVRLLNNNTYDFTVYSVDEYYNTSLISNIVTQQINGSPAQIPLANIISEYKFENNVLDTVGSNNGTATDIAYERGGAVGFNGVFNGTSSIVKMNGSASNLDFNGVDFSVSQMFKTTSTDTFRLLQNRGQGGLGSTVGWQIKPNPAYGTWGNILFDDGQGNFMQMDNIPYNESDGNWHHLIMTWKASTGTCTVYIDGINKGSKIEPLLINANLNALDLIFGGSNTNGQLFDGGGDCCRIFNTDLTDAQVLELATKELSGIDIKP